MVTDSEHLPFLKRTFALAELSQAEGNHPFGALLVLDGKVVSEAQNTACSEDCTGHAELNLVKDIDSLSQELKSRTILYTSTEPCLMCAGAIYWAGIRTIVFSVPAARLFEHTGYGVNISCRELFSHSDEKVKIVGPLLEEEGFTLHRDFW